MNIPNAVEKAILQYFFTGVSSTSATAFLSFPANTDFWSMLSLTWVAVCPELLAEAGYQLELVEPKLSKFGSVLRSVSNTFYAPILSEPEYVGASIWSIVV